MKLNKFLLVGAVATGLLATSCEDFLDRAPISALTPEKYYKQDSELAAYAINLYTSVFSSPGGGYNAGPINWDDETDNMVVGGGNTGYFDHQWLVGANEALSFSLIRSCNYFFQQVLPKHEAGQIQGNKENIDHYIGEMYFIRAMAYFSKLKSYGDFPIITEVLIDDMATLREASRRAPRNEVAKFIISDLEKAEGMLKSVTAFGKNRIGKELATLVKARVALYEATWEKHHAGTAFVPGGQGWPGTDAQGYNMNTEVTFFLGEAMSAAKVVADKLVNNLANNTDTEEGMDAKFTNLNPYYTMFCDTDMDKYAEVLMWREYIEAKGLTHNIQMQLQRNGGGSGWTRGLVNSFVMRNGLPIYDPNSGYKEEWEVEGVTATLQDRDSRIQIFTKRDGDIDMYSTSGDVVPFEMHWVLTGTEETRNVTGYAIKKGKHYNGYMQEAHDKGTTGSIVFRGTEALLNYMEASCELNDLSGKEEIDATAASYWKALRKRAKINEDYTVTVNATDLTKEAEGDWAVYSKGQPVSKLLYNIRRERRNEFIGEGMRWADLKRWRALDQVKNYQVSGMRYWGSIYDGTLKDADGNNRCKVDVASGKGNMSPESDGVYVLPNRISSKNNLVFNGYNWCEAHYLNPLAQSVFRQTATGDKTDLTTSNVYQNPGWPLIDGQKPTGY